MVLGQLIFKARITHSLWGKILDSAKEEADEGFVVLQQYLEEPVNCHVELIKNSKWCNIELGADSFRNTEWMSIHKVMSTILNYAMHDVKSVQYYEWQGIQPSMSCMDPFDLNEYEKQ